MKELNLNHEVYHCFNTYNDIPFQIKLPLQIEILIDPSDPVWTFNEVMEGVNLAKYLKYDNLGRKPYNLFKMLKVILYSEMLGGLSYRELEERCKTDIRFMYLLDGETPSHSSFYRLCKNHLTHNIKDIFYDISEYIFKINNVNMDELYIDGTKFEANANKFTFVWKKTAVKSRDKSYERITKVYNDLNKEYNFNLEISDIYDLEAVDKVISNILSLINRDNIDLVYGKGKRKAPIQRLLDDLIKHFLKLIECLEKIEICGPDRNSYSKSDHDATMMHMKEDYYSNTGIFKAGYNVQLGVSDEFIVHVYVSQDRSDHKTLIPFLESYKERYKKLAEKIIADAGYGSYDNYMYLLLNQRDFWIKYSLYSREKTAKFKRQIFNKRNFKRDEDGNFICPNNKKLVYLKDSENYKGLYMRVNQTYVCEDCGDCPLKKECTKSSGNRHITHNPVLEEMEARAKENLDSEEGIRLRINRSVQSEGAFGIIKSNNKRVRFRRRGLENITLELYLICLGFNLMKYHNKKNRH